MPSEVHASASEGSSSRARRAAAAASAPASAGGAMPRAARRAWQSASADQASAYVRIELERAPGVTQPELDRLPGGSDQGVPALQVLEVRLGVHRGAPRELRRLGGRELDRDLPRHGLGQLALQAEHVLELAVVAVGPERLVAARGDELHADAHAVADEQRRALEDRVDVQLARDLGERLRGPLVLHRRGARDHAQRLDAGEVGDDRLGHAVGEVLLRRVARDVAKREHGDGADRRRGPEPAARRTSSRRRWPAAPRATCAADAGRCAGSLLRHASTSWSRSAGSSGRSDRSGRRRVAEDLEHQRLGALLDERPPAGGHLEEQHAEGVDVGAGIVGVLGELLGRHVGQRADDHPGLGELRGVRIGVHEEREAEVEDLRLARGGEHDVAGLQVAMENAALVGAVERVGDRGAESGQVVERQRARVEPRLERAAGDVLHDQEVGAVLGVEVEDGGDAGVGEAGEHVRLAAEALAGFAGVASQWR